MNLALFDLDNTLLHGDSDHAWGEFLVAEGIVDAADFKQRNDVFYRQYSAGTLDIQAYLQFVLSTIAGKTDGELDSWRQGFMQKRIETMIHDASWPLLAKHQDNGDLVAIVTATNAFVTEPIAARLGVAHLIACEVEKRDGRYTGKSTGVPSFREGKIYRVNAWLEGQGKRIDDFEKSYFYSDSLNDLPLLKLVSHPIAVDPDDTLRAHATAQGWPIMSLRNDQGRGQNNGQGRKISPTDTHDKTKSQTQDQLRATMQTSNVA